MRKVFLALLLTIGFISQTMAAVQYQGTMDRETAELNASIELECDDPCPVSRWTLTWNLPKNSEIIQIRDSLGEITDYERTGSSVRITTNTQQRRTETVRIWFRKNNNAERIYKDLFYRNMSVPSFNGEQTSGRIEVDNLISGRVGYGFESSFVEDQFTFSGTGPTNIRVNFGEGQKKRYYEFFGEDRDNSSEAYEIAVGTTGLVQNFPRFPIAIMDNRTYNNRVNRWSSGEYISGAISLRDDLGDEYLPVLTHETVHGLNDRFLRWDQTRSTYLDEGVSEHAEFLMKKKLYNNNRVDTGTREVFGEDKKFRVEEDDGTYIYTLSSQGDRERLWEYYSNDREFMKYWNPGDYPDAREFGYAYSELMIKNYIVKNGQVRDFYSNISGMERLESAETKWDRISEFMEMEPCNFDSKERFNRCLDRINDYDYSVYTASPVSDQSEVEFNELKIPNRTKGKNNLSENFEKKAVTFQQFLKGFIQYLADLISKVFSI